MSCLWHIMTVCVIPPEITRTRLVITWMFLW
uniref:Uncharacterized protein n=1 Tax=Siphoviridae sp. ctGdK3 TaxID=2826222 RepID=A0A8S5MU80_9CAUD|nr:MAG TPA: hypothetical protein [Siphoviridae sp. ctGdK3]